MYALYVTIHLEHGVLQQVCIDKYQQPIYFDSYVSPLLLSPPWSDLADGCSPKDCASKNYHWKPGALSGQVQIKKKYWSISYTLFSISDNNSDPHIGLIIYVGLYIRQSLISTRCDRRCNEDLHNFQNFRIHNFQNFGIYY